MTELPTISVVIPNLNCVDFIERTILSVLEQEYPKLDLILTDGGSTDGSMEVVEKYRDAFSHIISGPDTGQANAVNKGFAVATGDVMGWINSDDVLIPGGLATVGSLFALNKNMNWMTGRVTCIDEEDNVLTVRRPKPVSRVRLLAGDYQWVQQESTYWRRDLWDQVGGQLNENLKLAVDGELWLRFSRHTDLVPVHAQVGAFRFRKGQRSEAAEAYHAEMLQAIEVERQAQSRSDDLIGAILDTPLELRSRTEAEGLFPSLSSQDPKAMKRPNLWVHSLKRRLNGI